MPGEQPGELEIDGTFFAFPDHWDVDVFDTWNQFAKAAGELGLQGCDVVACGDGALWIIEMKDYTYDGADQPQDLARTVGLKAAGTMATLYALQRSTAQSAAQEFAVRSAGASRIHLVLHVEVKDGGRKAKQIRAVLMPLEMKLKKVGKALGLSASYVTSTLAPDPRTPWTARRDPSTRAQHRDR
ncbi:hypothetical protein [Microbacterium sp. gxy059]|uniref:hypothetical protein n=1 Tax=Microbacterium sp. gxy059 TaxID=2957199 RepID=UPI003D98250B